ncbi:hypothetical protein GWK47_006427 [Chionoecetes opilio]|uniref:Uncharacterized protein n=1 Tax=Chionoecetes opilio TaxID=41210 RepID=A0A8J4Y714_CHIOP|nr:hypothetical protein GWK47_006427 [Chionoecetes opilio]
MFADISETDESEESWSEENDEMVGLLEDESETSAAELSDSDAGESQGSQDEELLSEVNEEEEIEEVENVEEEEEKEEEEVENEEEEDKDKGDVQEQQSSTLQLVRREGKCSDKLASIIIVMKVTSYFTYTRTCPFSSPIHSCFLHTSPSIVTYL